jgi:diguanylate cyclase (GGDEF)-like protein
LHYADPCTNDFSTGFAESAKGMTLYRQISFSLLLLLMFGFTSTVYISTVNLRSLHDTQLASHAQDTATSLGLSLSPHMQAMDTAMLESMISAVFDRGDFQHISLLSTDGETLVEKSIPADTGQAPAWFVRIVSLDTPMSEALVMAGWRQAGTLRVTGNPGPAYNRLWASTLDTLKLYLVASIVILLVGMTAVSVLLRPLQRIQRQADAICRRSYTAQEQLPRTRELRSVVIAMNRLSAKVNEIFNEQSALTEALREQVYMDPVTGIGNRRYFDRISLALVETQEMVSHGALLILELHDFQRINETAGYTAGDTLLKRTGELIQAQLDCLENCYAARISGASFGIIAAGLPQDSADALAAALCHDLFQLRAEGLVDTNNIGHVGVAMWQQNGSYSELLSEADMALRSAQASGHNTWLRHEKAVANQPQIYGLGEWRRHMHDVINRGDVMLAAQPVYGSGSQARSIVHREALLRFPDNSGSGVAAGIFMPMAERLGLASRLDKLAATALLEHLGTDAGGTDTFALNLSSTSLHDTLFMKWLCSSLAQSPENAGRILIEFPEYAATENLQTTRELVEQLNSLGCSCGIDHFGKGFSSFGYLRSLQLGYLKIDGSHIRNIDTDRDNQFFIQSLTDTMHSIDIKVYAQAVETRAERKTLETLGIDGIQGYLCGKPEILKQCHMKILRQE